MLSVRYSILWVLSSALLSAQTAPCGRQTIVAGGSSQEERFLPAPAEHVRTSLFKAMSAMAITVKKDNRTEIFAKFEVGNKAVARMHENNKAGVKGFSGGTGTAYGEFRIGLRPDTEHGVQGTRLSIEFHKRRMQIGGNQDQATPLMEETACLVRILSASDPLLNPRGPAAASPPSEKKTVRLPEDTPVKVLLREVLYSKDVRKKVKKEDPDSSLIPFEVAEDVVVDGATVVRRGALGTGRLTQVKGTSNDSREKQAILDFVIDKVTAVDGQAVSISAGPITAGGRRRTGSARFMRDFVEVAKGAASAVDYFTSVYQTMVRAGTGFDVVTDGTYNIEVGK